MVGEGLAFVLLDLGRDVCTAFIVAFCLFMLVLGLLVGSILEL